MTTAKRGTSYPSAPTGPHSRHTVFELQVRPQLRSDLPEHPPVPRAGREICVVHSPMLSVPDELPDRLVALAGGG